MIELIIAAGLVNWLATTIVVESELARPLRDLVVRRRAAADRGGAEIDADRGGWRWLDYLLRCHLCAGVWIGIAEALYLAPRLAPRLPGPAWAAWPFAALLIKAVGHLILEVRPQAWYGHRQ